MLLYHLPKNNISIELVILSGGLVETGKTPTVTIRNKDTGNYFDFASRTFTSTTVSATAVLNSAIDGLYTFPWDISNLFNNDTYLTFEYTDLVALDPPAFTTDDIAITTKPSGGGVGPIVIKGQWTAKQKKQILDDVEEIKEVLKELRKDTLLLLRKILSKQVVTKEDINLLSKIKERDKLMWQELLKILKLREDSTTQDVLKKLSEYNEKEEQAKKELLKLLEEKLTSTPLKEKEEEEDE